MMLIECLDRFGCNLGIMTMVAVLLAVTIHTFEAELTDMFIMMKGDNWTLLVIDIEHNRVRFFHVGMKDAHDVGRVGNDYVG
jgi:hypothetical protein